MSDPAKRILIMSSATGGGHQSAATALEESFKRMMTGNALVNIAQVLEDACFISRRFADVYNYLLRNHQHYMRYYYWTIEKIKPYESNFILQQSFKYGRQLFERLAPNVLVSVHPMTQHFCAYVLKKLRLIDKVPLITVVTDPFKGFWKGWACDEVSQYFVASHSAKMQLVDYGVDPDKIQISGMPVHARFKPIHSVEEKQQLRKRLNLHPDRFTVMVNSGWIGGGNVPMVYQTLMELDPSKFQVVFMTGTNANLYQQAVRLSKRVSYPMHVVSYTDSVEDWMNASDVMLSKLGGLTTFEAMACHLPILADCMTPPMPQEMATVEVIKSSGAGILIRKPGEILQSLQSMLESPEYYEQLKKATKTVACPGAVDEIASQILAYS